LKGYDFNSKSEEV